MPNEPDASAPLRAEIAKLAAAIASLDGLPDAEAPLKEQLAARQRELAAHGGAAGPVVNAPHSGRDTNIATSQTIVNLAVAIYRRDPGADQRAQLARYLDRLAARLSRLPLRGLDEHLDRGDGIALAHVYVMLATDGLVEVARGGKRDLKRYFEDGDLRGP